MEALSRSSKIFSEEDLYAQVKEMITERGLQASGNALFRGAVFGRDSLWTARFLIAHQDIAHLVLTSLAQTQGTRHVPQREEEPGKIAHEYRRSDDPNANQEILQMFQKTYGQTVPGAYIIYTTVDATPLWVVLLGEYCERYGRSILSERVEHITGEEITIGEVMIRAAKWIEKKIHESELGLLETIRENGDGHAEFHVLRDGKISYRHEDGKYPNLVRPLAYLEVQGYAYDALTYASEMISHLKRSQSVRWKALARRLQAKTFELFWQSDRETFAAALDRDPASDEVRALQMLSTVQPEILNSGIFDSLPKEEKFHYIAGVLKNFFTPEFQTSAGPRSIALRYKSLTDFYAYQGPETMWPILAHLVARGLSRQGYFALAYDIAARMVNTVQAAGSPRELFYITGEADEVVLDPEEVYAEGDEVIEIYATNTGEANQTWTIAALLEAKSNILNALPDISDFEKGLLGREMTQLLDEAGLEASYSKRRRATINFKEGNERQARLVEQIHW
ncbi:hypothetical protein H7X87_01985 [Acetobacteraceae bacterium]|nr:hypothetical protein [Candidatus Parcubacteria bacterium]